MLFFALPWPSIVGKPRPFLPPMTGNGLDYTHKNGDFPGGWCVSGIKFYPHSEACCGDKPHTVVQHKESRPTIPPPSLVASVGFDSLTRSDGTTKRGLWVGHSLPTPWCLLTRVSPKLRSQVIPLSKNGSILGFTTFPNLNSHFCERDFNSSYQLFVFGQIDINYSLLRFVWSSIHHQKVATKIFPTSICLFRTETVSLSGLDSEEPSARWKQSWQRLVDAEVGSIPVNYIVINCFFFYFFWGTIGIGYIYMHTYIYTVYHHNMDGGLSNGWVWAWDKGGKAAGVAWYNWNLVPFGWENFLTN